VGEDGTNNLVSKVIDRFEDNIGPDLEIVGLHSLAPYLNQFTVVFDAGSGIGINKDDLVARGIFTA
jgi:hypothetical protein